ncbi:MAG: OmpH family outer membrane protein [Bacteroidetes bacterium]|nr:OmpH family outer membrane protein [Bacteroidota bacterium]
MKKNILALVIALFTFAGTVSAQQKIGHINSVDILTAMPEFKAMQDELQKQKDTYTKVLEGMYGDYEKKQIELQNLSKTQGTPDAILEVKYQELQQLQQRIQDFEEKVNNDLQKAQQEKLKPINDKYMKAVKEVATANGYAYILDVVSGALAYFPEGTNDVTDLVMKKLGVTPAPSTGTK